MRVLVKLGGTLLENRETRSALAAQLVRQARAGVRLAVVHGGGKRLSAFLSSQNFPSEFRRGLRVTPPEILDAVLQIYAGLVNHELVAELQKAGGRAVGLSGIDAGLAQAVQLDPELGAVGRVERVDASILELLTDAGYTPAVACVAGGENGAIYNVNADEMAAACAMGFRADALIFLTDVGAVLDENGKPIPRLTSEAAEALIASGVAAGGMEAKLRAAISAVRGGVGSVRIADGAGGEVISRLLSGDSSGTLLTDR